MPSCSERVPCSSAPRISSRRNSALPSDRSARKAEAAPSTGPPTMASISCCTASAPRPVISIRSRRSSFHRATTASGAGSPDRMTATTNAARVSTIRCTRVADASSRRWASSTTSSRRRGPADSRNAAASRRSSSARAPAAPVSPSVTIGSRGASAPNGSPAADRVPVAQAVTIPERSASSTASRASRVLPTPAGPARRAPREDGTDSRSPRRRNSGPRPVNGHSGRMPTGVGCPERDAWSPVDRRATPSPCSQPATSSGAHGARLPRPEDRSSSNYS